MTIAEQFFDYQHHVPAGRFDRCSPALGELRETLAERWSFSSLGCFGVRPIRLGELPSTHSYGAAIDLSYRQLGRVRMLAEVVPYLIAWSDEWGIQAVHDYVGCRIWRAGRTRVVAEACDRWWKAQRPSPGTGMGQAWADWLHIEIHPSRWDDARSESERL